MTPQNQWLAANVPKKYNLGPKIANRGEKRFACRKWMPSTITPSDRCMNGESCKWCAINGVHRLKRRLFDGLRASTRTLVRTGSPGRPEVPQTMRWRKFAWIFRERPNFFHHCVCARVWVARRNRVWRVAHAPFWNKLCCCEQRVKRADGFGDPLDAAAHGGVYGLQRRCSAERARRFGLIDGLFTGSG